MDKIEEEKLLDILEIEKKFINNINFSDEPMVYPIDMTNGFVIDNVPEPILKKLALQIDNIYLENNTTNYLGQYETDKSYSAGKVVTYQNKNYISTVNVPAGTMPYDTNFWQPDTNQNPKNMGSIHYSLAGHIKHQYSLYLDREFEDYIFYLSNKYLEQYPNFVYNIYRHNAIEEHVNLQLKIYALWVNFMKKYEFNPPHSHSGRLSFVLWYKVPFTTEDEMRYGPSKRIDDNNYTACFQFLHPSNEESGIAFKNLRIDKSYEGKIILFPSYLCHAVYPFYTSDDYRISIAGNVRFENGV